MESMIENKTSVKTSTRETFVVVARSYPKSVDGLSRGLQQNMRQTMETEEGYPVTMVDTGYLIQRDGAELHAVMVE
jgi:hypothetical protein